MPDTLPLSGPQLLERFRALDDFLLVHQAFWRPRPFNLLRLPWEEQHPALAGWLRRRSLEDAEACRIVEGIGTAVMPPEMGTACARSSTVQ